MRKGISFIFWSAVLVLMPVSIFAGTHPQHIRCATTEVGEALWKNVDWAAIRAENAKLPAQRMPEYNVGDQKMFWVWDLSVMPPVDVQVSFTCRAKGDYGYVWVEDSQWGTAVNQDQVDAVFNAWEVSSPADSINPDQGIYQNATSVFGDPPDVFDHDVRINIVFYDIASYQGSSFDGFFNAYDEMSDEQAQTYGRHSNEMEIVNLDCNPSDPSDPYMLGVLSHEFQHMIHWNYDQNEATWVNEGCSQLSWFLCGYGTDGAENRFANNPNNDLTSWDQTTGDYGQVTLFFLYLYEQFGGVDAIRALVSNVRHGFDGMEATFNAMGYHWDTQRVVTDWTVANYLDNPTLDHGQYGYNLFDTPAFKIKSTFDTYPTGDFDTSVKNYAARYYRFADADTQLNFTLDRGTGDFNGYLVAMKNNVPERVIYCDPQSPLTQVGNIADGDTIDLILTNRNSAASPANVSFNAVEGETTDTTPPYIVVSEPWGYDVSTKTGRVVLNDELSGVDTSKVTVKLNDSLVPVQFSTTPDGYTEGVFYISRLAPETQVDVEVNAQDMQGNAMSAFHYYFETAEDAENPVLGVTLNMSDTNLVPGDICFLDAIIENPDAPKTNVPLFVLLDVFGTYYSAPEWQDINEHLSYYTLDLDTGRTVQEVLPAFYWPEDVGSAEGLKFYGAMTTPDMTELLGEMDTVEFGWGPQ